MVIKTNQLTTYVGCGFNSYSRTDGAFVVRSNTKDYGTTPGYFAKRKAGDELPTNPYSNQILEKDYGISSMTFRRAGLPTPNFYYGCAGLWVPGQTSLPVSGVHDILYNKCVSKLPRRVNGENFNSLLFMFEWRKTADMVRNLAKDIADKFSKAKSRRQMQNIWLEYRYGWRLLVYDIHSALTTLHSIRNRKPKARVSASATLGSSFTDTLLYPAAFERVMYPSPPYGPQNDLKREFEIIYETFLTVRYKEAPDAIQTLTQLGITNPLLLAWELIPYSFVVDWIIPVSDYLSTLDSWVGKTFVSGSVSYVIDTTCISTPVNVRDIMTPAFILQSASLAKSRARRRFYKRVPLATFPTASLPNVQLNLDVKRLTDAVALMVQRVRH